MVLKLGVIFCVCLVIVSSGPQHLRKKRSPQDDWFYLPNQNQYSDYTRRSQFQNYQNQAPQQNPQQLYKVSIVSVNLDKNKEIISHNVSEYQLDLKSGNAVPIPSQNRQNSQQSTLNNMHYNIAPERFSNNAPPQYIEIVKEPPGNSRLFQQDRYLLQSSPDKTLESDRRYSSSNYDREPSSHNQEPNLLSRPPSTQSNARRPTPNDQGSYQNDKISRFPSKDGGQQQYYSTSSSNRDLSYDSSDERTPTTDSSYNNKKTTESNNNNTPAIDQSAIEAIFGKNPQPNSQSQKLINNGRGVPLVNDQNINSNKKQQSTRPPLHRFQAVAVTPES